MTQTLDYQEVITNGIQGLPKKYLSEVADFVLFLLEKSKKQQEFGVDSTSSARTEAMLRLLNDAKHNAPVIDKNIDIRKLIDETHDREI